MPDTVTPSAFSPAAQPKAAVKPTSPTVTQTPAPAVVTPTAPPAKSAEAQAYETKLQDERRRADIRLQRQKVALTAETKKEREARDALGPKLSRLAELEKLDAQAKMNPEAFLKAKFGDDWYDHVVKTKLNGGVPTADVLASEIAKVEERVEAKWKAREEELAKTQAAARDQSIAAARRGLQSEAATFWKTAATEFPVLEGLGDAARVASLLAERIEVNYNSTIERDEEGQIVRDGQILTLKQAAEALENQILALSERAVAAPKYAERFKPKVTPNVEQPSRTLSNALTGSTPGQRPPPANSEEKRARATAAYLAARKP